MSTAAVERRAVREGLVVAPALALAAAMGLLLARVLPDIGGKPWHEDEAVAGLISARPLGDVLHTVVLDRGGAPLHFLFAHAAFAVDGSPQSLRWLSLAFALATIPLCYDLARRLAGRFAGMTAAALAATSQLLTVYATFGRMYSLFAFSSALALDLFVRALERPTRGTLSAATAAALLPLTVHPFGVFVLAAELAVALWRWRLRAAPVAVLALPFALPYLRLPGRYAPDVGISAPEATARALGGSAGGYGVGLLVFAALAAIGACTLPRTFAALGLMVLAVPPVALATLTGDKLSPRHLIFVLPVWTTFVAAGLARIPFRAPVAVAAIAVAALAPAAVADPRTSTSDPAGAAAWVRAHVTPDDALYPYSAPFLAALPHAGVALPREPVALERIVGRTETRRTLVAIPNGRSWSIIVVPGPFANVPHALARAAPKLHGLARAAALQLYATSTSTEGTSPHSSSSR
jgi:Dolichyl-phosphate-mannose-protein mannosyltransferase